MTFTDRHSEPAPDEPTVLAVDRDPADRTVVVDTEELQAAWKDPKVQALLRSSRERTEQLRAEGRIIEL